jgi:hypothetical protein
VTDEQRDQLFEVVWSGGEGLTADRETLPSDTWQPPKRIYNRTGRYKKTPTVIDDSGDARVIDPLEDN